MGDFLVTWRRHLNIRVPAKPFRGWYAVGLADRCLGCLRGLHHNRSADDGKYGIHACDGP